MKYFIKIISLKLKKIEALSNWASNYIMRKFKNLIFELILYTKKNVIKKDMNVSLEDRFTLCLQASPPPQLLEQQEPSLLIKRLRPNSLQYLRSISWMGCRSTIFLSSGLVTSGPFWVCAEGDEVNWGFLLFLLSPPSSKSFAKLSASARSFTQ